MSHEQRITELKLELPPAPKPVAVYKPLVIAGSFAHVSGHGPLRADKTLITGRVGAEVDAAAGKAAARQTGLAILATLRSELGSLDRVKRVIKVLGMVNCTPDFRDHPAVINGCSELFRDVFGEDHGVGARSAVGMGSLPGNITVEIEAIFELSDAMRHAGQNWFEVSNASEVPTPALLLYPHRVLENIRRALSIVGDPQRLCPHVKTHKLAELVQMHLPFGVTKFKCATIAEAEMTAHAGAPDVLLAYQPVGANARRLLELTRKFPRTRFSTIVDDRETIITLARTFDEHAATIDVLLDINCGMDRTGIRPGDEAASLFQLLADTPGVQPVGLHAYDGHIHDSDVAQRTAACEAAFKPVFDFRERLVREGFSISRVVAGGTPTFPMHARRKDVECSPGTYVFWDFGYAESMPDLPFDVAAVLMTRVVSKPLAGRLCLDFGHKAVAAENPHPRVKFLNLAGATAVMHSEEHLVIETARAADFHVGDVLYGVPRHICPTVALHGTAVVVRDGHAGERWKVEARNRVLTC